MKMYLSAFLLISSMLLTGCGKEEFGTPAQGQSSSANPLTVLEQNSCANLTLVNPQVDILYVVDNSTSSYYVPNDIKTAIRNTISSVSADFDYRVIGTPLLQTSSGNGDFQVLAKNPAALVGFDSKKVASANDFSFFSSSNSVPGSNEPGLARVRDFLTAHSSDGLFRQNAYLFIILVSNGRDTDVEKGQNYNPQETFLAPNSTGGTIYGDRLNSLKQIKLALDSKQFRLFSVTGSTSGNATCQSGYLTSNKSYVQMSRDLYESHTPQLTDQSGTYPDHYNLCGGSVSSVFTTVNASIKKIVLPHTYKYWPITFTSNTGVDASKIKVFKSSPSSAQVQMVRNVEWKIPSPDPGRPLNTRTLPTPGEPTSAANVIEFLPGHEIVYPQCVSIVSESNLEYFKYIVMDKQPQPATIVVKVNGRTVPSSAYTYRGQLYNQNTKVAHNGYSDQPPVNQSGFFIEITSSAEYYKSGDNVEVSFVPAGI